MLIFGRRIIWKVLLLLAGILSLYPQGVRSASDAPARLKPAPAASAPSGAGGGCARFSLVPPSVLAEGLVATAYRQQVRTSNQTVSLQFKIANGRLPDGLRLEDKGQITGTPEKAGLYRFTVQAWANCPTHANRDQRTYTLTIRSPVVTISAQTLPDSLQATAGRDVVHPVRYLLKSTSPSGIRLHSTGGQFLANGRIVGRTKQPLTITIKGRTSWIGELLTLHRDVMAAALRSGNPKLTYIRNFTDEKSTAKVETRLEISILPPRAVSDLSSAGPGDATEQTVLPGQIVVTAKASPDGRRAIDRLAAIYPLKPLESFEIRTLRQIVAVFSTQGDVPALIKRIRSEQGILHAQPNRLLQTFGDPRDDLQHIYKQLNLEALHKNYQGKGTRIAVIDTGVDLRHPDLQMRIVQHANLIRNNPYRAEIHGTAVAGVMAAAINGFGISGIAPQADLIALRACWQISETQPEGRCTSVSVSKALDMAIEGDAQVVNMSFGTATPDRLMMQLIEAGAEKSIVFVAPVGNQPTAAAIPFPASHSKVLAVGGIDDKGTPFPNRTLALSADICAPASHILCTIPGGGHNFLNGTSLSAAIVSGIVAVAKEKNRHLGIALLPAYEGDLGRWQEELMHLSTGSIRP